ncbi:hypothetical protein C8R44DRAFT_913320 [Mycena epipterygia]|nr:hypothetical protein C8R44DRAFT_913320 [Mycena epipterygia]
MPVKTNGEKTRRVIPVAIARPYRDASARTSTIRVDMAFDRARQGARVESMARGARVARRPPPPPYTSTFSTSARSSRTRTPSPFKEDAPNLDAHCPTPALRARPPLSAYPALVRLTCGRTFDLHSLCADDEIPPQRDTALVPRARIALRGAPPYGAGAKNVPVRATCAQIPRARSNGHPGPGCARVQRAAVLRTAADGVCARSASWESSGDSRAGHVHHESSAPRSCVHRRMECARWRSAGADEESPESSGGGERRVRRSASAASSELHHGLSL